MHRNELLELADRIEATETLDPALSADVIRGLWSCFPTEAAAGDIPDSLAGSSDAIIGLVNAALPGWHFKIHGRARHSLDAWSCSLRQSDVRDDDEILGTGTAACLSQAILAAVIRVGAWR